MHYQHHDGDRNVRVQPSDVGDPTVAFQPVWRLIERQASQQRALEFPNGSWSYGDLWQQSGQIAGYLADSLAPQSIVAVSLNRSPEFIATLLGILRAGCVFLPIDPKYPTDRIRFILDDAAPDCFIVDTLDLHALPPSAQAGATWSSHRIDLTVEELVRRAQPYSAPEIAVSSHSLAYAIYTSGSTGRPKAALLEHGGLTNLVREQCRLFQVTPLKRVLQFSSIGFDATVSEIFVTLAGGATLVLAPELDLTPGPRLAKLLQSRRITDVTLPPSVLNRLGSAVLPELSTLVVAGEACSVRLAQQWGVGRTMINAYGPTEATVCVTMAPIDPRDETPPAIGYPLSGVTTYVVDEAGNEAEEGELWVGGIGVALGYLRRPELTQQKFVLHTVESAGDPAPVRVYRTGDRVKRRADGALLYLGRIDDEVKINGVRIDLGEIQARLEADHDVQQAVVCVEHKHDQPRLLGFVQWRVDRSDAVTHSEALDQLAANWERLWAALRAFLPVSHWPSELIPVTAFPLTAHGKIDRSRLLAEADAYRHGTRQQLRVVTFDDHESLHSLDNSESSMATELRDCWMSVLPDAPCHARTDFFLSGGDSLSAMELLARVAERTGRSISIAEFVRQPTLDGLAALLGTTSPHDVVPNNLVKLQSSQSGHVLICVHPGGGHVMCYQPLARALQPEWNVYGLQADGVDGRRAPQRSIPTMCDNYVAQVERAFSGHSVSLLGWSFGGLVAYEMMRRLADSRQVTVDQAWILDAAPLYSLVVLRSLFPDSKLSLRRILNADRGELQEVFADVATRACLVPPNCPQHEVEATFQVFMANVEATLGYRAPRYAGRVNLLLAEEGCPGMTHDIAAEWQAVAADLRVQYTEGAHLTVLQEPYVHDIARRIRLASIVALPLARRRAA